MTSCGWYSAASTPSTPNVDKPLGAAGVPDSRAREGNKTVPADDKIAAMQAYRRARGLCQFCADKWARGHKCAQIVQLHAVQELWELLQVDQELDSFSDGFESDNQLHMLLSQEALALGENSKTLKFVGVL
jgi:hypothetical protein